MPRSGTTIVEQIISSHSKVTGAGELPYVSSYGGILAIDSSVVNKENIFKFREKYILAIAKRANGNYFVTDKMPQNFRFIPLLCAALPEAKIIHVRRDKAATCWSNFKQYFAGDALGYSYDVKDVVRYYGLYESLMHFWQSLYKNQIYNLDYDKLTSDQEIESKRLIEHLKLDWEDICLSPQENERIVLTASQHQIRKKVYKESSQAWKKFRAHLDGAFEDL